MHRTRSGGRPVRPGQDKGVAHHTRSGGRPVRPGQENTRDRQHPTTPAVRRRRQQHTNKTSRASSRLQHHEQKPEHADTAGPTKGGATHKHGTLQQRGGHAPTQHRPRPRKHHRQPTPDNAGRTATETTANQQNKPSIQPATTPRTETRTRRHSRPHQGGGHAQTGHAPIRRGGGTHKHSTNPSQAKNTTTTTTQPTGDDNPNQTPPSRQGGTNTAHPSKRGGTHQQSGPHQEGGHNPTQQAPPGGGARTSTAPTPARQTTQTTNTRQCRPYGGGDNSEPTKPAGHPAGYNTTNRNPNTQTPHSPPRGGSRTNTTRPKRGGGGHAPAQHQPRPSQQDNRNPNRPDR